MRAIRRASGAVVAIAILLVIGLWLWSLARSRPQDLPWTPLDLGQPIGMFTAAKLGRLGEDFGACRALLDRAGVRYSVRPPVTKGACGYRDGVRLERGGARQTALSPASVGTACPVAAALAMWEWSVLQPAAEHYFGARVTRIDHLGSYNCRGLYGRADGPLSEHATADAIDIAGFRLSDGTQISVLRDWEGRGPKAGFLHEARAGACGLFATTLSPDYNAAHRDHLHLDQASRGSLGWRACR